MAASTLYLTGENRLEAGADWSRSYTLKDENLVVIDLTPYDPAAGGNGGRCHLRETATDSLLAAGTVTFDNSVAGEFTLSFDGNDITNTWHAEGGGTLEFETGAGTVLRGADIEWEQTQSSRTRSTHMSGKTLLAPPITQHHAFNDEGCCTGGETSGVGFAIRWQDGPWKRGEEEPNGAFVENILEAAAGRLRAYEKTRFCHPANAFALFHIGRALAALQDRHADRAARGVLGSHEL